MMRKRIYPTKDHRAHVVEGVFGTAVFLEYRRGSGWSEQDAAIHSRKRPRYWRSQSALPACQFLDGDACWYEGSYGLTIDAAHTLRTEGADGLFDMLERWYVSRFGDKEVTR